MNEVVAVKEDDWDDLTEDILKNPVRSMQKRGFECIMAEGGLKR